MFLEPLSGEEKGAVHGTAIRILEEVGLALPAGAEVTRRLAARGLDAGPEGRLRLPRAVVEGALASAPRVVRLGGRSGRGAAVLDGTRTYVTTDGCGARTVDPVSGTVRPSVLRDVERSARLTDALPGYDVYWTMVSAQDVPPEVRVAREYVTAAGSTTKHVQMIDVARPEEAEVLVRMAATLREAGVAEDPPVSILISVVSPLRLDPGGTEAALAFAGAGLPVAVCSMPIASVTAPATPAGLLALAHAEILGLATILQILRPGAPLIYCAFPAFADARTGTTNYQDPRRFWAAAAATTMGRVAGLPVFTSGEIASLLVRPDLLCFGGLLEVSTLLSFEQLVIDHELLRDWTMAAASPPVDAEALAYEAIREVGPGGHFLTHRHTARHIREFVVPRYHEADRPVASGAAGAPDQGRERARAEAARRIEAHRPEPLPDGVAAALHRLAERPAAGAAVRS
jgi:trimethylamine--corrinoid protein Co-methyltransferase